MIVYFFNHKFIPLNELADEWHEIFTKRTVSTTTIIPTHTPYHDEITIHIYATKFVSDGPF